MSSAGPPDDTAQRSQQEERRGLFGRFFRRQEPPPEQTPPMRGTVQLYSEENMGDVPNNEGVIALWERANVIYLGAALAALGGIRSELLAKRREGGSFQSATHFQYEVNSNAAVRLKALLDERQRLHGSLPRCNQ
jgi:hypothetical protein